MKEAGEEGGGAQGFSHGDTFSLHISTHCDRARGKLKLALIILENNGRLADVMCLWFVAPGGSCQKNPEFSSRTVIRT